MLRRREDSGVSLLATAGLDTIAVRAPAHPVAHALLRAAGRPLAAPSANRSGRVSPTEAAHVATELDERVALILDGGRCAVGLESTVLDLTGPTPALLRPGGTTLEALTEVLGPIAQRRATPPRRARRASSPAITRRLTLRLNAVAAGRAKRCSPSGRTPARFRRDAEPVAARRPRRGGGQFLRDAAPARPAGVRRDRRRCRSPTTASAGRSTTACAAPPPRGRSVDTDRRDQPAIASAWRRKRRFGALRGRVPSRSCASDRAMSR